MIRGNQDSSRKDRFKSIISQMQESSEDSNPSKGKVLESCKETHKIQFDQEEKTQ